MTANPIGLLFRHVVQARLEALFRRGDRVLDLGCGTGEHALMLAARGVRVVAVDASNLDAAGSPFDGAYSTFGALGGADLPRAGAALAAVLRPGAAVVISLLGPWPLPAVIRRTLTGMGDPRRGRTVGSFKRASCRELAAPCPWRCQPHLFSVEP